MLALSVIGCLLAAILIMLLVPVRVFFFTCDGVFKAHVRYLFLKYDFFPEKTAKKAAKKVKRKTKKEFEKQEDEEKAGQGKPKAAADTVKTLWSLLKDAKWGLNYIRRRLVFYRVRIYITVGGPDAHDIAVSYGRLSSVVYLITEIFGQIFPLRNPDIRIAPDFLSERTRTEFSMNMRIAPMTLLVAAVNIFMHYFKSVKINKDKRQKIKGKIKHEPTASHQ